jgi:CheY-like chemotaxis protein
MGGTLTAQSVLGEGSTFAVELPLASNPLVELMPPEANPAAYSSGQGIGETEHQRMVLSIEDNLSNYRLIEKILERRPSVKLLGAMQGQIGLDLASQHLPDLILLDLHLPDIPGHEILTRLRQSDDTAHIPVVVVSADATQSQIDRLLADGAQAYLTKPLNVKQFMQVLDDTLQEVH